MKIPMKPLTIVFWIAVAGVGASFTGSVLTAVKHSREKAATIVTDPSAIPTPAIAQ